MINKHKVDEVKKRLVDTYKPLKIYIFGSYAWGRPTEDSDLDILVVVKDSKEKKYKRAVEGYGALFGLNVPSDILVYTEEEFDRMAKDVSSLCFKIKEEGEVVYASA